MELIDKSALVAEIEKLMNRYDSEYDKDSTEVKAAKGNVCHEILCTIDTLEVKEVEDEPECKIFPRPVECYSTCKECPWLATNNKAQKGE